MQEVAKEIASIIDHAEKVAPEKVKAWLDELAIGEERVEQVLQFIEISGEREVVVGKLRGFGFENEKFNEGVAELEVVLKTLEKVLKNSSAVADMKIVRGLDYYTGTVFETILPDYKEIGSICSGGRYENLAELYTDQKFPGVGGSIGLTRLFYIMSENGLVRPEDAERKRYAVVPFNNDEAEVAFAHEVAAKFRGRGKDVDIVFSKKKLGDKIKYVAKTADYLVVVGENEVKTRAFKVKNLLTGEEADSAV